MRPTSCRSQHSCACGIWQQAVVLCVERGKPREVASAAVWVQRKLREALEDEQGVGAADGLPLDDR